MKVVFIFTLFCFYFIGILEAQTDWQDFTQVGKAARYDSTWNNVATRSGELVDMRLLEGAHAHLPFGTVIEVTNLDNQKKVKIRINERPYTKSRILDMTLRAADSLDFGDKKIISIRLKVIALKVRRQKLPFQKNIRQYKTTNTEIPQNISKQDTSLTTSNSISKSTYKAISTYTLDGKDVQLQGYGLQVGSYFDIEYALKIAKRIENLEIDKVFIQSGWSNQKQVFRILVGVFPSKEETYYTRDLLKQHDYTTFAKKHY